MNRCFICGHNKLLKSFSNKMFEEKGSMIIIKEIPCLICENCNEVYFETKIMQSLEKIIESNISELEIIHYSRHVA